MMGDWVKAATLVVSVVGSGIGVAALVVTLQIRNAVLEERDRMKEWVRTEIRNALAGMG